MLQSSPQPNRVDSRYHERAVLYCAIIDVCNYVEIYACLRRHDHTLAPFHSPSLSTRKRICNTHEETRLISLSLSLSLSVFSPIRTYVFCAQGFFFFPLFNHDENVRGIRISPTVNTRLGYFAISRGGPRRPVIISFKNPWPPARRSTRLARERPAYIRRDESATNNNENGRFCPLRNLRDAWARGRGKKLRYAAGIRTRRRRRRRTMPFA